MLSKRLITCGKCKTPIQGRGRQFNRIDWILGKVSSEKKVSPGEVFILMSFNVKAFTQVNQQQMWMNFNTFLSSSHVNCVIRINFKLNAVHKGWKLS